jgi:hypothetical protein
MPDTVDRVTGGRAGQTSGAAAGTNGKDNFDDQLAKLKGLQGEALKRNMDKQVAQQECKMTAEESAKRTLEASKKMPEGPLKKAAEASAEALRGVCRF